MSKHREESRKYNVQRSTCIFDEIQGVWVTDETLFQVFDSSSQIIETKTEE